MAHRQAATSPNPPISGQFSPPIARHVIRKRNLRMETPDSAASLMDDRDFLKELAKLEARPRPGMTDVSSDALLAFASEQNVRPVNSTTAPQFMMPVANAEPTVEAAQSPMMRPALAAVGFVLMMSIGAGAAALVFHERVTQIVTQWNGAR